MDDLPASGALAALVAALGRGEHLSPEEGEILAGLQAQAAPLPEELTITLRKPLKVGDLTYNELRLREPTAAEWTSWSKLAGVEGDIKAISVVAGVPEAAIRQIGTRDLLTAGRYIGAFLS